MVTNFWKWNTESNSMNILKFSLCFAILLKNAGSHFPLSSRKRFHHPHSTTLMPPALEMDSAFPFVEWAPAEWLTVLWPSASLRQWATLKSHCLLLPSLRNLHSDHNLPGVSPLWYAGSTSLSIWSEIICLFGSKADTWDWQQEAAGSCLLNEMVSAPAGRHPAATRGESDSSLPLHSPRMWGPFGDFQLVPLPPDSRVGMCHHRGSPIAKLILTVKDDCWRLRPQAYFSREQPGSDYELSHWLEGPGKGEAIV